MTSDNVSPRDRWLEIIRVPLVVVLLLVTGRLTDAVVRSGWRLEMNLAGVWRAWVPLALLGTAAAVAIVTGRRHRHRPAVLTVEAVVAATFGFVPTVQWIYWLGFSGVIASSTAGFGLPGFVQPLGMVWLVTVVMTAVRQRSPAAA